MWSRNGAVLGPIVSGTPAPRGSSDRSGTVSIICIAACRTTLARLPRDRPGGLGELLLRGGLAGGMSPSNPSSRALQCPDFLTRLLWPSHKGSGIEHE